MRWSRRWRFPTFRVAFRACACGGLFLVTWLAFAHQEPYPSNMCAKGVLCKTIESFEERETEERTLERNPHSTILDIRGNTDVNRDPRDVGRTVEHTAVRRPALNSEQVAVRNAFMHAWRGYKRYAWGHDELKPFSRGQNDAFGGLGLTIVDSLDTLFIMGLWREFDDARKWVEHELDFDNARYPVSFFETTIRFVGGFLSTYYLTGDEMFLEKAVDLADRLMVAYDSPSGLPYARVELGTGKSYNYEWGKSLSMLAEVGTVQLEYAALSRLTGRMEYTDKAEKVTQKVFSIPTVDGLRTIQMDTKSLAPVGKVSFNGMGDSYYEYLLKRYKQSKRFHEAPNVVNGYLHAYTEAMNGMVKHLVKQSQPGNLSFIGEVTVAEATTNLFSPVMEHLACFVPGMLALGAKEVDSSLRQMHLDLADDLAYTCYQLYNQSATGLAPDMVEFNTSPTSKRDWHVQSTKHLLRPETVESLFVLYQTTGDNKYREWGWELFQAWERQCKIPTGGYSGLWDANSVRNYNDAMESFFLGETLKYLFLLFDDSGVFDLDEWVFNTEAHPLKLDKDWSAVHARAEFLNMKREGEGEGGALSF